MSEFAVSIYRTLVDRAFTPADPRTMATPTRGDWLRAWLAFYDNIEMATAVLNMPLEFLLSDDERDAIFMGPGANIYSPTLTANQYLTEMTVALSGTLQSYRVAGSSETDYVVAIRNAMQVSINASIAGGDFQFAPPAASGSTPSGNPGPDNPDAPSGGPTSGSSSSGNPPPLPPVDPPDPVDPPGEEDGE